MTSPRPTKAARREAAREKARAMREAAERRQRRRRNALVAAVVVAVLAVVVGVGVVIQSARSDVTSAAASSAPANVTDGGIVTGPADAPHTVSIYLDYQCPACKAFETQNAAWLEGLRDAGKIRIEYKPIAILDRFSSTQYSTRAANAAACVADSSPKAYTAFNDDMFARQPPENSAGLPDDRLVAIARGAGASADVEQCISDGTFTDWVASTTDAASRAGVQGTPTVLVDGQVVDNPTRQALEAALS